MRRGTEGEPQKAIEYELAASGFTLVGRQAIPDVTETDGIQTQGSQDLPVDEALRSIPPDIQFAVNGIVFGKDPDIFRNIRDQGRKGPARFTHQPPTSKGTSAELYLAEVQDDDDYEPDPEISDIFREEQQLVTISQHNEPEPHVELQQVIQKEIDPISDETIRTEHYIEPPSIEI